MTKPMKVNDHDINAFRASQIIAHFGGSCISFSRKYRGVRRAGGKRGAAEYFGTGVIGEVWQDPGQPTNTPARQRRWFCAIEDYQPFDIPVPAKKDGVAYESIANPLGWRTGVREIPLDVFDRILRAARSRPPAPPTPQSNTSRATLIVEDDPTRLFLRRPRSGRLRTTSAGTRKSDHSREVGDWAEGRVLEHLRKTLSSGGRDSLRLGCSFLSMKETN